MRDFAHSLPMALLKAREAVMAGFRPDLDAHDLTEQQWRVLRVLTEHPGITAGELAERAALLKPSLSRIVGRLEERGLVDRRPGARDLRLAPVGSGRVGGPVEQLEPPGPVERQAVVVGDGVHGEPPRGEELGVGPRARRDHDWLPPGDETRGPGATSGELSPWWRPATAR